ncbi:MAG: hypothetical protein Q4A90_04140 [Streptococcus sp.]|nr:hypothetical protein [Streptococcus sp.]
MNNNEKIYRQIIDLLTKDTAISANLQECFESPEDYFEDNYERFEEYGMDDYESDDFIIWGAIAIELIENKELVELDWSSELEEFFYRLKNLADRKSLDIKKEWFNEDDDIPTWCKTLDENWKSQDYCVGAMDLDSDTYVLFVCKKENLEKLKQLVSTIDFRFDYGKNM